jgi:hypothetical protein
MTIYILYNTKDGRPMHAFKSRRKAEKYLLDNGYKEYDEVWKHKRSDTKDASYELIRLEVNQ